MIYSTLRAFLEQPVMMIVAADGGGGTALGRCLGARLPGDSGPVEILFSRLQWPDLALAIAPGRPVALTLVHPATYRTYQLKGCIGAIADADAGDLALAHDYVARVHEMLGGLGVDRAAIDYWCVVRDMTRVVIAAEQLFDQTPGPRAGAEVMA